MDRLEQEFHIKGLTLHLASYLVEDGIEKERAYDELNSHITALIEADLISRDELVEVYEKMWDATHSLRLKMILYRVRKIQRKREENP